MSGQFVPGFGNAQQPRARSLLTERFAFRSHPPVTGPNPDRVPMSVRRAKAETVSDMMRHGWHVIAVCRACRTMLNVDLRVIAKMKGPGFSLWNRSGRCRRVGCTGHVDFLAKASDGMTGHQPLLAPFPGER